MSTRKLESSVLSDLLNRSTFDATHDLSWAEKTWTDDKFPGALLPAKLSSGEVCVYALADHAVDWRRLRPMLQAFVGRTFSTFDGRRVELDSADPLESKLAAAGFYAVARLAGPSEKGLLSAAGALVRTSLSAPPLTERRVESTASMLAQFDKHLVAHERDKALAVLQALSSSVRIDDLNLGFLEVKLHAEFGDWRSLRSMKKFVDLCRARRSRLASSALLDALYHVDVAPLEEASSIIELAASIDQDIRSLIVPLLTGAPESTTDQSWLRLRVVEAIASGDAWHPSTEQLDSLSAEYRSALEIRFPANVPEVIEQEVTEQEREPERVDRGGFLNQLWKADNCDSIELARQALTTYDSLPEDVQQRLTQTQWVNQFIQSLRRRVGYKVPPADWVEWLGQLPESTDSHAAEMAQHGVSEWSHDCLSEDASYAQRLLDALESVPSGEAEDSLANSVMYLIAWLRKDPGFPRKELSGVCELLLVRLALALRHGYELLVATEDLVEGILGVDNSVDQYLSTLETCDELLESATSGTTLPAVLSISESIIRHPCADRDALQSFWHKLSSRLLVYREELDDSQKHLIRAMERTALRDDVESSPWATVEAALDEAHSKLSKLGDNHVAVYTLTPGAAQQVKAILSTYAPKVKLTLRDDKVCTQQLRDAARSARIFVVVTRSATHSATDCIQANRPADRPVHYAAGRGASSILATLEIAALACA
ncbi:protein DpdD [Myxococcota bacterium]